MTTPTINCVFENKTPLGATEGQLIAALQKYVDECLAPSWGVHGKLQLATGWQEGQWTLVFADNSDQAQALGYHDLSDDGPCGFVFVQTSQRAGASASETASHELAELLLDPGVNLGAFSPRARWIAREVCDPVQGQTFALDGLPMANFVLPSWYGSGPSPYDWLMLCKQPWEILPSGYVPVWDAETNQWNNLFGSNTAAGDIYRRGGYDPLRRWARRNKIVPGHQRNERLLC